MLADDVPMLADDDPPLADDDPEDGAVASLELDPAAAVPELALRERFGELSLVEAPADLSEALLGAAVTVCEDFAELLPEVAVADPDEPNHFLTPLCPLHAPDLVGTVVKLPSLHCPVTPACVWPRHTTGASPSTAIPISLSLNLGVVTVSPG